METYERELFEDSYRRLRASQHFFETGDSPQAQRFLETVLHMVLLLLKRATKQEDGIKFLEEKTKEIVEIWKIGYKQVETLKDIKRRAGVE